MGWITALAWAMPLVLTPLDAREVDRVVLALSLPVFLQIDEALPPPVDAAAEPAVDGEVATAVPAGVLAGGDEAPRADDVHLAAQLRERERLRPWHVGFGIATNVANSTTLVLGYLQYSDRYGFGAAQADTPCARGAPLLGTEMCSGAAWPHAIAAATLTTLVSVTFLIAAFMPDPLDAASGQSTFATVLRAHRALRWVVAALIVAQAIFGAVIGSVDSDYETGQALAGAHLATGTLTGAAMLSQAILGSVLAEL